MFLQYDIVVDKQSQNKTTALGKFINVSNDLIKVVVIFKSLFLHL